ncbi:WD repeat-containing protein 49 [Gonapodya sp. JEL0774]|nr:WD repeat-containing protein 49 [Gonapodya sp. JEL0774]
MKIDANSDGCLSWDEFSTYMMMGAIGSADESTDVFDERIRRLLGCPHRDMIRRVDFVARERKYMTVARDGTVCFWSPTLRLQRTVATKELYNEFEAGSGTKNGTNYWVMDAVFLHDHGKLVVITDHRQLCIYDVLAIKPRAIAVISPLEDNPLCVSYHPRYDDERDLMLFGDDGGFVNVLSFTRKFFIESSADGRPNVIDPAKLGRKDSLEVNNISLSRRKVHSEWVQKVCFLAEMNAFISCAPENSKSLVIGDMDRKAERYIHAPKGINCFEYCRRPSFLVTGGRDKVIRLWNPYVLSKPAGTLYGHNSSVTQVLVNQDESHIISLSEDKIIKVWNARNMTCLQTLTDKVPHRPENVISTLYFDSINRRLLCGSNKLETFSLFRSNRNQITRTHDASVVAALFNENFHQVVSGSQNGTVTLWNMGTGEKIFQFHNLHDGNEITAMCFDKSGRRLITGSRDGKIKMWNFNNGQLLKVMIKDDPVEVTDLMYIEIGSSKYIVAVGWDEMVSVFMDDPGEDEARPCRVLAGEGIHKGHTDDITSIAFSEPNILATSGVDGSIVLWNLESGHCKGQMQEPYCHLRNPEEKAIEKVWTFDLAM